MTDGSNGNGERLPTIPPPAMGAILVPELQHVPKGATADHERIVHANNLMALQAFMSTIADSLNRQNAMLTLIWQELRQPKQ